MGDTDVSFPYISLSPSFHFYFFWQIFIYLLLAVLGLCWLSLVAVSRSYSLFMVLSHWGTQLSCPKACMWNHPRPGIELLSLALVGGFLTSGPPGKSSFLPFLTFNGITAPLEWELSL